MQPSSLRKTSRIGSVCTSLGLLIVCTCGFDGGCLGLFGTDPTHVIVSNTAYKQGALVGAVPRPYQKVFGQWLYDASGEGDPSPHGSRKDFGFNDPQVTDQNGKVTVSDVRLNAYWQFGVTFEPSCQTNYPTVATISLYVVPSAKITDAHHNVSLECATTDGVPPIRTYPYFDVANPPASIDIPAATSISGYSPNSIVAFIYDRNGQLVTSTTAIAILSDGMTATFPTPSVASDMYGVGLVGTAPDGSNHFLGSHTLVAGSTIQNQPQAFGVDGASVSNSYTSCQTADIYNDGTYAGQMYCQTSNSENRFPVVSLYNANQISFNGANIDVGVHPTTVLTYGSFYSDDYQSQNCCNFTDNQNQGTQYALVLNSGSNSVSVVDLQYGNLVATLSVGVQPTAVSLSPDLSNAYVVSYDGILTRINLSNLTVTGSTYVGVHPTSVAVNQSQLVTVGGENFISSLDGNSLSITASQATDVQTIALAALDDNQTLFANSLNGASGQPNQSIIKMSNNLTGSSVVQQGIDSSSYGASPIASSLANSGLMANGLRSGVGIRDFVVTTTPSGFSAFDGTGALLMTGQIPGLTRSIGLDPDGAVVYFASPDNNAVIVVPLPTPPTQDPTQLHFLAQ